MNTNAFLTTTLLSLILLNASCKDNNDSYTTPKSGDVDSLAIELGIPLERINLPDGFNIMIAAYDIENPRQMAFGSDGTLFIGTRTADNVYALRDEDGDYRYETKYTIAEDLNSPNGVAFKDGDLYVAEIGRIIKFTDVLSNLKNDMSYSVVTDSYPEDTHHGWKYIAFGPDDKLYVPVGAPCNICEPDPTYASITRINSDGTGFEVVQHGIRNSVGFTWHPETNDLWFTDNGRDYLGDDLPACELNHATKDNMHFGYPYCHQGDYLDPEFGSGKNCEDYTPPAQKLGPHVAPLGLTFYTGNSFPSKFHNQIFIAEHGSWNRSTPIGYRITNVFLDENYQATSYTVFADGWLEKGDSDYFGRPVDIKQLPDGSILVSDDFADVIYRIFKN